MNYGGLFLPEFAQNSPHSHKKYFDPCHTYIFFVKTLAKQIEAVQNRAARFFLRNYRRKSSNTAIKQELKWSELEARRKVACLIIFHQSLAGQLAVPVRNFLCSFSCVARCLKHQISCQNKRYIQLSQSHPVLAKFKNVTNIETCMLLCCNHILR